MIRKVILYSFAILVFSIPNSDVLACGGFFCLNVPVDQNAEKIIFTQNHDGTISAIVQIQYVGEPSDFSWILPIPHPIDAKDIEVPDTAISAFLELEIGTAPVFIPPDPPQCARQEFETMAFSAVQEDFAEDADLTIYSQGEVGPYGFVVIGAEDPSALITWLREHNYQVTTEMEPLIDVYVDEGFSFLAMQLLPDQGVDSISPIKLTYNSKTPMIPLRLTAVAATDDMAVQVWIYADRQAVPVNYAHMKIADEDLTFFTFGGNNYRQLIGETANEYGGQAFITEYAAPTRELIVSDPLLQELSRDYAYLTRLNTVLSPEEMTVDPVFAYDPQAKDVSNIHDLSGMVGLYDCEREEIENVNNNPIIPFIGEIFSGNNDNAPAVDGQNNLPINSLYIGIFIGFGLILTIGLIFVIGFSVGKKRT